MEGGTPAVVRLRELLAQYYSGAGASHRQQLEAELVRARDDAASVPLAWEALHEPAAAGELLLWFAALVLDRLVLARWDALGEGAQLETLTGLRDLLAQRSASWPRSVQLKVAQVYVRAGRQLWPERAPGFYDDVLAFLRADSHRPLGLHLVESMVTECGEPSRRTLLSARRRALARPLAEQAPATFAHLARALEGAPDDDAAAATLAALVACAQWLPVSARTVPDALVPAACARLGARSHAVRFGALACLRTLFDREVRGADAARLFLPALVPLEAAMRRVAAAAAEGEAESDDADAERCALCEAVHSLCASVLPRIGDAASVACTREVGALLAALLALTAAARTRRAVRDAYGAWAALLEGLSAAAAEGGGRPQACAQSYFGLGREQFAREFGPGFGALLAELARRRAGAAGAAVDALVPVSAPSADGSTGDGSGVAFGDDDDELACGYAGLGAAGYASADELLDGLAAGAADDGADDADDDDGVGGALRLADTDDDESEDEEEGANGSGVRGVPSRAEAEIVHGLLALWPAGTVALLLGERARALCARVAEAPDGLEALGCLAALAPHLAHAAAALGAVELADAAALAAHVGCGAHGALGALSPPPPPAAPHARAATAARVGLLQLLGTLVAPLAAPLAACLGQAAAADELGGAGGAAGGALALAARLTRDTIGCAHAALHDAATVGGEVAGAALLARAATALTRTLATALPAELWLPTEPGAPLAAAAAALAAACGGRNAMAELLADATALLPRLPPRARARLAFALATAILRAPAAGGAVAYDAPRAAAWRARALGELVGACVLPWRACGLAPAQPGVALDGAQLQTIGSCALAHDGRTGGWALARATAASARSLAAVARAADGASRAASDAALRALSAWLPISQHLLAHYGASRAPAAAPAALAEAAELAVLSALSALSALALALARGMRAQLAADGWLDALLDALVGLAAADRAAAAPPAEPDAHEQPHDGGAARAAASLERLLLRLLARVGGSSRHWSQTLQLCAARLCGLPRHAGSASAARYHCVLDALVRERWRSLQADGAAVGALVSAYAAALLDPWDRAGFRSALVRLPRADAATGGLLFAHAAFVGARPALAAALVRTAIEPLHSAVRDDAIAGLHALAVLPPGGCEPLALVDEALAACAHLDPAQREQLRAAYAREHADARDLPSFKLMMASLADDILVVGTVQADRATLHVV